ncbi:MAG: HesA/MoeB/ThiF family protein [Candidatus Heimdallarchaeaceae archaeon]
MKERYIRLKSLAEFGIDVDWSKLFSKKVLIIGTGGVGSIVAEMLTRCGIGDLFLIDLDTVEEVNLNRLFFTQDQIGKPKVEVAKEYLKKINEDVKVHTYMQDVCALDFEQEFELLVSNTDLTISCLDNMPARLYVNEKCVKLNKAYVDSGASRSGLGGYVHLVVPYKTACYNCTGSIDLGTKEHGEPCTASLPSTIAIVASLVSEITLKFLLGFGTIPDYIGFNALNDQFIIQKMNRDPNCYICGNRSYSKQEQEYSLKDVADITEGKTVDELIKDLKAEEKR